MIGIAQPQSAATPSQAKARGTAASPEAASCVHHTRSTNRAVILRWLERTGGCLRCITLPWSGIAARYIPVWCGLWERGRRGWLRRDER
jgi:hypothetical protein